MDTAVSSTTSQRFGPNPASVAYSSAECRLPKSLYFAESDVIFGDVRARSVHKAGNGHYCGWAAT
jgi:hypothetical protein